MIGVGIVAVPTVSEEGEQGERVVEGEIASCSIDVRNCTTSNQLTQIGVSDCITSEPLGFVQANCPPSVGTVGCARSSSKKGSIVDDFEFFHNRVCGGVLNKVVQCPAKIEGRALASVGLRAVSQGTIGASDCTKDEFSPVEPLRTWFKWVVVL